VGSIHDSLLCYPSANPPRIVEQDLGSALILEDDVDWDIGIKAQMNRFASAAHVLLQPLAKTQSPAYLDPTFPSPPQGAVYADINVDAALPVIEPTSSPYGDTWDVLWLGHCGTIFPAEPEQPQIPRGRAVFNDPTVPAPQHIKFRFGSTELVDKYPPHTRVVSHTMDTVCSLAYAVSQRGARKILYELGVKQLTGSFDLSLRDVCDGKRGSRLNCLTAQPQYFQHHRPYGQRSTFSDINAGKDEINEVPFTRNIRWSVRMNLEKLVNGVSDLDDQFPDAAGAVVPDGVW